MARIRIDDLPPAEDMTPEERELIFGAGRRSFRPTLETLGAREMLDAGLQGAVLGSLTAGAVAPAAPFTLAGQVNRLADASQLTSMRQFTTNASAVDALMTQGLVQTQGQGVGFSFKDLNNFPKGTFRYVLVGHQGDKTGPWVYFDPTANNGQGGYLSGADFFKNSNNAPANWNADPRNPTNKVAPSFELPDSFNLPDVPLASGQLIIIRGDHALAIHAGGDIALPDLGNKAYTGFSYDVIEFSRDPDGTLWINTTQVDQLGMGLQMNVDGISQTVGTNAVARDALFRQALADWKGTAFQACYFSDGKDGGESRLINPSHLANDKVPQTYDDTLGHYWDNYLAEFYATGRFKGDLKVTADDGTAWYGFSPTKPAGQRQTPEDWAIEFTANADGSGDVHYVYDPRHAPSGVTEGDHCASYQVFACSGVYKGDHGDSVSGKQQNSLEKRVVAALNRGVALNPELWDTPDAYYKPHSYTPIAFNVLSGHVVSTNMTWNRYAGTMHSLSQGGFAYGFAYDDVGDHSATLHGISHGVTITLGAWGATPPVTPATPGDSTAAAAVARITSAWDSAKWIQQHTNAPDLRYAPTQPAGDDAWKAASGAFSADGKTFTANFDLNNKGLVHVTFDVTTGADGKKTFTFDKVEVDRGHYLPDGNNLDDPGLCSTIEHFMNLPDGGLGGYSFTV